MSHLSDHRQLTDTDDLNPIELFKDENNRDGIVQAEMQNS